MNSEFYPGWLTHWGENLQTVSTLKVVKTLDEILSTGASVNIYMFFGGTNFGFKSGKKIRRRLIIYYTVEYINYASSSRKLSSFCDSLK